MTIDIEAIRARAEAATPGPWYRRADSVFTTHSGDPWIAQTYDADDAKFVAHARQDIPALIAEIERLRAALADLANGNRPLPANREDLGRLVRECWVRWAQGQEKPKPHWLVPWEELDERDKEVDRQIGETIARWTIILESARVGALIKRGQ